ncbi:MAG: endonuclease/exonuclease/phosphatase family protein [Tenuifilaceae bacterium]|nr:MAG: Endonuclease/Exonuclease/phosphatase family protein [Bacteroidetes bacterium ADurb.Bin008]
MTMKFLYLKIIGIAFLLQLPYLALSQEKKDYKVACIAFYNLENLFDTLDTPGVNDFEYTPAGPKQWNTKKYLEKLDNLSKAIAEIGTEFTPLGAVIIGVSEVENRDVLVDLAAQGPIASRNYEIVHYDGPDKRGVDVALLYQPRYFTVTNSKSYRLIVPGRDDFFTRDQLLVSGVMDGDTIHIIVTHWPSRSGGESRSRPLRIAAADLGRHIIDSLQQANPKAKIIFMGDLNDNPDDISVVRHLKSSPEVAKTAENELFNPFYSFYQKGYGSLAWRDTWSLFDQILISKPLTETDYTSYRFYKAHVFNKKFLQQSSGRFKGYPFRTHAGNQYLGGYSDHFPTLILLVKEKE